MVVALSYLIAVILTVILAVLLYPIAGIFWGLGLFGRISDKLFGFTTKVIRSLWNDLRGISADENVKPNESIKNQWVCSCGCSNSGKFCSECGAPMPEVNSIEKNEN